MQFDLYLIQVDIFIDICALAHRAQEAGNFFFRTFRVNFFFGGNKSSALRSPEAFTKQTEARNFICGP